MEEGDDEDKAKAEADEPRMEEKKETEVSDQYCFRVLCEWEQVSLSDVRVPERRLQAKS